MIGRKKAIEMLKIADAALQNNGAHVYIGIVTI